MLRRCAILPAVIAALMLLGSSSAQAGADIWDSLDCSQGAVAGCELLHNYP